MSTQNTPMNYTKEGLMPREETLEVARKKQELKIGIPKESFQDEGRIGLTPLGVELLVNNGHQVIIESNAGFAANFDNHDYSEKGAIITENKQEVFNCDIVLKVGPVSKEEIEMLRGNQILFSSVHIRAQKEDYLLGLIKKRVTAIGFEYLKDENDCYPVVRSMSEIAGKTSVLVAAEYLSNAHKGKGEMMGGITGVKPTEVVILGAGTAGEYAARTALGLGAMVKVFDASVFKLRRLQSNLGHYIFTSIIQPKVVASALKTADVAIGAIRYPENSTPFMVSEEIVKQMKKNSIIVDISIDQGGCFETSRITSHNNPVYNQFGVIHYCVPNAAARVARTASYAISNIFTPLLMELAGAGDVKNLIKQNPGVRNGVYLYNGILTNSQMGNLFDISSKDIDLLLAAF
ncbi:MAG: alanine dehydrogenase [Bacteroidales bacterium]|nr:alanine dehydrogenase [Bacteroidales bacterium]